MAYVALYRAYRPQAFSEVAGQRHIVRTLQNAIKLNKVAHAYLFCGPRGTGKTSLAKIFAKAINCENGPTIEPCNTCQTCIEITKSMVNDVIEIDAASNNGVDEIRDLRDKVRLLPSVNYRVYIIDEVHMLSIGAFNALLKTLEEPPSRVVFILATTEVHKIPATILSRCQRFDFQSISAKDVYNKLKEVVVKEDIKVTDEALHIISEICDGGMRDALSLLDQSITYSKKDIIDPDDVFGVSGSINRYTILHLLDNCLNNKGSEAIKQLTELLENGKEAPRIVNDLISFLRDILLFKHDLIDTEVGIYAKEEYQRFCYQMKPNMIYAWLKTLNEVHNNMRFSTQKQVFLELGILTMANKLNNDYALVLDKVEHLERELLKVSTTPILTTKPIEPQFNYYENYVEDNNKVLPEVKAANEEYIDISMIEDILNNGNKLKKEALINLFKQIVNENVSEYAVIILCKGEVVASNEKTCLVVLKDESYCNRVMRQENFIKIIKAINSKGHIIDDYICITVNQWSVIKKDFGTKYQSNPNARIKLDDIKLSIVKHSLNVEEVVNNDPFVDDAIHLFGKDNVDIID